MPTEVSAPLATALRCASCGTELAPDALSCPACLALVHADRLKELAASAERLEESGQLVEASGAWNEALSLIPRSAQQYTLVQERVSALQARLSSQTNGAGSTAAANTPWYKRGIAGVVAVAALLLGKLKFLILGLTKASTFFSMFAFFGIYWNLYGWPLALGLVLTIYIHEMGHVAMLKRLGIHAGAPLFIPGFGALVLLKQHIKDPSVDAKIGLAGPVWGLGAGVAAYLVYAATGIGVWGAIAGLTGFINLFNLIPVWQLDGSRGFHALSSWQRWVAVLAIGIAGYVTGQRMMLVIGIVAAWRAFQRTDTKPDTSALATYIMLVFALAWLSVSHSIR